MTDGSPAVVADLRQLETVHPTLLGTSARYKGTIDPAVYVGAETIVAEQPDDTLFAEAEWSCCSRTASSPTCANPTA